MRTKIHNLKLVKTLSTINHSLHFKGNIYFEKIRNKDD